MTGQPDDVLVCVDIGNQRCKLAWTDDGQWRPTQVTSLDEWHRLSALPFAVAPRRRWFVSSVHRPTTEKLSHGVARQWPDDPIRWLSPHHFGVILDVDQPSRVGADRVAAAAAAGRLMKSPAAVVVDVGTAVTVDWVSRAGGETVFHGGAILPSPPLAARALADHTDALPLVSVPSAPVAAVGRDTQSAIEAGIYWGLLGSVRELIQRGCEPFDPEYEIFMTGGSGAAFAEHLGGRARYEPHLVLRGVHWAAQRA